MLLLLHSNSYWIYHIDEKKVKNNSKYEKGIYGWINSKNTLSKVILTYLVEITFIIVYTDVGYKYTDTS